MIQCCEKSNPEVIEYLKAENACAHPYTTDFWPCLWNARVMTNGWDRALLVSERTDNAGATSHPSAGGGRLVRRTGTVCSFHFGMYESCSIPSSQDVAGYLGYVVEFLFRPC